MSKSKIIHLREKGYGPLGSSQVIYRDFFAHLNLKGMDILEFGPGRCEMLYLFKKAGANCFGIDTDPAVIELGRSRGYTMFEENFNVLTKKSLDGRRFDGLFGRGVLSAFRYIDAKDSVRPPQVCRFILKPKGWAWILPYNTAPRLNTKRSQWYFVEKMGLQIHTFKSKNFQHVDLTPRLRGRYARLGKITNYPLFTCNLIFPKD